METPDRTRRAHLRSLGEHLTPMMIQQTQTFFAASFKGLDSDLLIGRDLRYGPHERHRLDIFRKNETCNAPVLVYVHGGGFVMGDKQLPGLPFYDNVGDFAARSAMVGVTLNYRLAPADRWPSGPEDMAGAIAWLRENIGAYGGDPDRIFLMGQSAGAVHVASYIAHKAFHPPAGPGLAGALLISGLYDIAAAETNDFNKAYFGEDDAAYSARSTLQGLIDTDISLLATISEFDIPDFQKQAAAFVSAYAGRHGRFAPMLRLSGHNHLSPALEIGSPGSALEDAVTAFIAAQTAPAAGEE
ncbi:MAG: alpha/beta hydrolase [Sphingomonadales bacterium]|nr:MAG: alpha/beta hydrolase [Sphingomonadales bacterium]TNF03276.1 MAG: alpha/beta hydrolase [Sphingomonadales bacterium]